MITLLRLLRGELRVLSQLDGLDASHAAVVAFVLPILSGKLKPLVYALK